MTNIKGIVFDWGGVIIDEPSAALQQYCSRQLGIDPDAGSEIIWQHLGLYQEKRITERELWERVCDACGQSLAVIPRESIWARAIRAVFRFRSEVVDAIEQLRRNGYLTGFLSNTEPEAAAYFYAKQMDNWFDAAVLSCEAGISKPHPDIYRLVSARMQTPSNQLLFLDDRQENIDGAHAVAMQAKRVATVHDVMTALAPFLRK